MLILLLASNTYSQEISNYLIATDIGPYKKITKGGPTGNILAGVDHFGLDHKDAAYGISYVNDETKMWIDVQVTQHSGSDSDKWLLHEVDSAFRDKYGIPAVSYYPWQIDGQTILINAVGGREYRWLSGNKVIVIQYHGSLTQTPEPTDVVKAYLAKHPSTVQAISLSQLRSANNKTVWIKDEMDRRLWLADKWAGQIQTPDQKLYDKLKVMVDSMTIFLNYREKYFGIAAKDEKNLLAGYLEHNDTTNIQAKLQSYKDWWAANKGNAISLP
jgi:hypothetical protein